MSEQKEEASDQKEGQYFCTQSTCSALPSSSSTSSGALKATLASATVERARNASISTQKTKEIVPTDWRVRTDSLRSNTYLTADAKPEAVDWNGDG